MRWAGPCALAAFVVAAACNAPTKPQTATLTVVDGAPVITAQPRSQIIALGDVAALSVDVTGTTPLSYQWFAGQSGATTAPIADAISANYTTPVLSSTSTYWVRISNAHGTADSSTAVVTVTLTPPPQQPPPDTSTTFEDQVLVLVNQRRAAGARCGTSDFGAVPALSMHPNLRTEARGHSVDMASQNYFSHTSLDGRTFDQRIRNAGYTGAAPLGENIAAGLATPELVVDHWMQSSGHCANIMSPGFRAAGVGYAHNPASTFRHYWTQSFGGS